MRRFLTQHIKADLPDKIVLLSGPRQVGKTTLSTSIYKEYGYYNYDSAEDRLILREKSWDRTLPLVIFDELHKRQGWKAWIKGIYDTEGLKPQLLVTGSAKLDAYKKVGDSLAGRYFQYRLHPLDMKEVAPTLTNLTDDEIFERLLTCSGFPEPFLKGNEQYYKRWRRTHLDIILRQDLLDMQAVRDIQAIETLVELLRNRVGSGISYANLARDLERDTKTIKRWLLLLENLYIIFKVTPYHKNIARSLLKEPKYYFYDIAQVIGEGPRFENLVACALHKALHYIEDTMGEYTKLFYLRTKEGKEIDFLVKVGEDLTHMIEVKWSDDKPTSSFRHFRQYLKNPTALQLVRHLSKAKVYPDGVEVRPAISWLKTINLHH